MNRLEWRFNHAGELKRRHADGGRPMLGQAAETILEAGSDIEWLDEYWSNHQERIAGDLDIVGRYPGRVLDVGAMPYFATLALHLQGRDVVGVDLNPGRLPTPGLRVVTCDIEHNRIPLDDDSVDVILFSEVFEHLRIDLLHTVGELRRILTRDGVLLLTTPNLRSVRGLVRLIIRRQGWTVGADPAEQYARLKTIGHMGHVREYTDREFESVLHACGLRVEEVIWRRKRGSAGVLRPLTWIEALLPSLRPYMTLVARRFPTDG